VLSLLQFDLPVVAAALLIGLLAGRWMFRRRTARKPQEDDNKS
jgi:hypothetical protein